MIISTLKILTGSGLSVLIGFISLPLLTRLYTAESFGALQLFQSLILYCIVYSSFRYEVTLLTIDDDDINDMTLLCFLLTGVSSLLTLIACLIFVFTESGAQYFEVLVWVPAAIFIAGFSQIFTYLGQRNRDYSLLSKSKVLQASVNSVSSMLTGVLGFAANGLIFSDLLGKAIYSISLTKLKPKTNCEFDIKEKFKRFCSLIKIYKTLPLLAIPGGFVNVVGGTLTSIMMFTVFNSETAGQFFLAEKVVILPFGLVAASVSQVFSSEFGSVLRNDSVKCRNMFWSIIVRMGVLGLIPFFLIHLFTESVFSVFFGEDWMLAAAMAKSMSLLMLVNFMVTPVNMAIMILGNQGMQLFWETIRLMVMSVAWYLIYFMRIDSMTAVHVHVICSVLLSVLFVYLSDLQIRTIKLKPGV